MHLPACRAVVRVAMAVPKSVRFTVPLLTVFCTVLPMAGLSNMHSTTWSYGQPLPFLDFYDSGGWGLWTQVWRIRLAVDMMFWFVLFGCLALACAWLHERSGELFSTRRAFFGFVFGIGVCLAQVVGYLLGVFSNWLGLRVPPSCIPLLSVETFFAHAFGVAHWLTTLCPLLVLFGCVLSGSLVFASGVRVHRPWSGLAIAVGALASFSVVILCSY
jgi:hypothetical protein